MCIYNPKGVHITKPLSFFWNNLGDFCSSLSFDISFVLGTLLKSTLSNHAFNDRIDCV